MRKYFAIFSILAATVISFSSCQKEVIEEASQVESLGYHTLTFTAGLGEETKTTFHEKDELGTRAIWTEEDRTNFLVLEHYTEGGAAKTQRAKSQTVSFSDGNEVATIEATFENLGASCTITGYQAIVAAKKDEDGNPMVASVQTPEANAYDRNADVLISQVLPASANVSALRFNFDRVVCINKMTLKNMTAGYKISQVVFESDNATVAPLFLISDKTPQPVSKTIVCNFSENNTVKSDGTFDVYFISGVGEFTAPTVTVLTDHAYYTKKLAGNPNFKANSLYSFRVGLNEIEGTAYTLVENNEQLIAGGPYVITNEAGPNKESAAQNTRVVGYEIGTTNTAVSGAVVAKSLDGKTIYVNESLANPLLLNDNYNGTYYFYYYDNGQPLYLGLNSSNKLAFVNSTAYNAVTDWSISFDKSSKNDASGKAYDVYYSNIVFTRVVGETTHSYYVRYNKNNSSPLFSVYDTKKEDPISIFKKGISGGSDTPVTPTLYNIVISDDIANGTVTASAVKAAAGTEITLTATPATGYEFESWNVTGATVANLTSATTTFTMPAADVNVSATFTKKSVSYVTVADIFDGGVGSYSLQDVVVMAKAAGNVIISDGTANIMLYEQNSTLEVGDVIEFENQAVTERNGLLQFNAPTYVKKDVKVTPSYGTPVEMKSDSDISSWSGEPQYQYIHFIGIMQNDGRNVKCGEKGIYIIQTDGYAGKKVAVWGYTNGVASANYGTITTTLVRIEEIVETTYSVTVDSNILHGTVTANPTSAVAGSEISLTITPEAGYKLESLSVSYAGGNVIVTNNKFAMPASDVTVSASFATIPERTASIAEAIAGDSETIYILTGTVSAITNKNYGNFTLTDASGSITIYGLLNTAGESGKFSELDIAEGDHVTLKGQISVYNGTVEIKNALFISREKAPYIRISPNTFSAFAATGGTVTVNVDSNVEWTATSDNAAFVISDKTASSFKIVVSENTSTTAGRTAKITISADGVSDVVIDLSQSKASSSSVPVVETLDRNTIISLSASAALAYAKKTTLSTGTIDWSIYGYTDNKSRPWVQLKKDQGVYFKISAPDAIKKVVVTITSATNSSGGVTDISKHTAYSGYVKLMTADIAATSSQQSNDVASSNSISNNIVTLTPSGDNCELYLKVTTGARIWGVEVTY